jgi:hypothetical protein
MRVLMCVRMLARVHACISAGGSTDAFLVGGCGRWTDGPGGALRRGCRAEEFLFNVYKRLLPSMGGYLTNGGDVNLSRADILLAEVGKVEDEVFRVRIEHIPPPPPPPPQSFPVLLLEIFCTAYICARQTVLVHLPCCRIIPSPSTDFFGC